MDTPFSQFSSELSKLAAEATARLFHVASPAGGRTALSFDGRRLLVPAREADEGEEVAVLDAAMKPRMGKVVGFDASAGFAVLDLGETLPGAAWPVDDRLPALGSLLLTLAYPSDEGPEARLDLVRIARGEASGVDSYIQTDGAPFPGFAGAALVGPTGQLVGVVAADRPGNHGWALPATRARALVDLIVAKGFPGRAWLGISTLPIETPEAWKARLGGREEVLMVVALEKGGPAAAVNLLPGDIIVSLGDKEPTDPGSLRAAIASLKPGVAAPLVILRGEQRLELSVTPAERRRGKPGGEGRERHQEGQGGPFAREGRHGGHGSHGHHRHGGGGCGCGSSMDR